MLRPNSIIRHISYVEFMQMLNALADRLTSENIKALTPIDPYEDLIPCAHLAYKLGVPLTTGGKTFSIYSDQMPDICMFKKVHESEHYNNSNENYLEEIPVESDGYHQKIKFEWDK